MLFQSISLKNFRCYEEVDNVPFHRLTVFIGENDAGKTVLLDAIRLILTTDRPDKSDYRQISKEEFAQEIVLTAVFEMESDDLRMPVDWFDNENKRLTLTKTFNQSGVSRAEVLGKVFKDSRFADFINLDAATQKQSLIDVGITPSGNKEGRFAQVEELVRLGRLEKQDGLVTVPINQLQSYLPLFELTSATDYEQPHLLVQKTLQVVVNSCIRQAGNGLEPGDLIPELSAAHDVIEKALNIKLAEAKRALKDIHPKVKEVFASPRIDFARSVQIPELLIDCDDGQGAKPLSSFGDGTKKRMWMGLLDWQREAEKSAETSYVIRAYDEPDMSLHYEAQRKLFSNMLAATSEATTKTQVIVCTHSLALVDRAPGESIKLIKASDEGNRVVEYLRGGADDFDVRSFLSAVGRSIGISNSALFYERVFLIVEGESEANAIPILYRNLYGHSLIEDGVVLINLSGSGAWKPFLKLLSANKADKTLLLLDMDCQSATSGARVTIARLGEVGFSPNFLTDNIVFIGLKEFEDAFRSEDIISMLETHYPRSDKKSWEVADVDNLRTPQIFMKSLMELVVRNCDASAKPYVNKPDISERLATHCLATHQIPPAVQEIFSKARRVAGIG